MTLILGSSSPWRRQVLENAGFEFGVCEADIDEKTVISRVGTSPDDLVLAIARAKSAAIVPRLKQRGWLITADQVVVFNEQVLEKPIDLEEARRFMRAYGSGHPVRMVSAIVVTNLHTQRVRHGLSWGEVRFYPISMISLEVYLRHSHALFSSGALVTDDQYIRPFIRSIKGEPGSIEGMPIPTTQRLLEELGYSS